MAARLNIIEVNSKCSVTHWKHYIDPNSFVISTCKSQCQKAHDSLKCQNTSLSQAQQTKAQLHGKSQWWVTSMAHLARLLDGLSEIVDFLCWCLWVCSVAVAGGWGLNAVGNGIWDGLFSPCWGAYCVVGPWASVPEPHVASPLLSSPLLSSVYCCLLLRGDLGSVLFSSAPITRLTAQNRDFCFSLKPQLALDQPVTSVWPPALCCKQ